MPAASRLREHGTTLLVFNRNYCNIRNKKSARKEKSVCHVGEIASTRPTKMSVAV